MKKFILLFLPLFFFDNSFANITCGIKPIPPIGCSYDAVCVCSDFYNCDWVFINCN